MSSVNIKNPLSEFEAVMRASDQIWYGSFINLEGNSVVGVSAKVPGTDWYILTEILQSLDKSVSFPLRKLEEGAVAIGEGNENYRIELSRNDEIGILANAFNKMADQVAEQRHVLEQRVLERTAELSQVNGQLLHENEEKSKLNLQIQSSLKEKEIILKEIHHRVKNNLQVISSLLSLQSVQIKDPVTVQLFRDSQNRVRSMALIHEKLYLSHDFARIDIQGYIQSLSSYLVRSFAAEARGVAFRLEIESIELGIDQAIPCGLIINELVSNSLKYAFPNDQKGEINISFRRDKDNQFCLEVGDNGVGFPAYIDFQDTTSLGLQLVNSLVNQLEGKMDLINRGGTEFHIVFSDPVSEVQPA